MKKIWSTLCAFAMVLVLAGCQDATASISDSKEALITVGGTKITKGDIYDHLVSANGGNATMALVQEKLYEVEGIEINDEMKKEAEDIIADLVSSNEDFEETIKLYGFEDLDDYKETSIYPSLKTTALNKKYIQENEETVFGTYYPLKAQIMEIDTKEDADAALEKLLSGEAFLDVLDEYATDTYDGSEQLYITESGLPTDVFTTMKSATQTGVIENVIVALNSSSETKYYLVNMTNIDPTSYEDEAINVILDQDATTLTTNAMVYFLKKNNFTIYDITVYNAVESLNSDYIVQE